MIKKENITYKQIKNMKHAIGIIYESIKRKRYSAYRNYYSTKVKNKSWEELVELGLAKRCVGFNESIFYVVTEKGLDFLGELMFLKITEMK